ncbi:ATP-dependent RNA helicase [Nematocida minor]|uniref:ATP-dependent RNA helicase n=1 Tax=Nematocida minor TaxID=1912983 RepID=UPI00222110E7|nr:ATP-dependent RNA helicase [Nematocida minor]KAI5190675.1 ATP-dependent RNA helicase [Nematocida minor]
MTEQKTRTPNIFANEHPSIPAKEEKKDEETDPSEDKDRKDLNETENNEDDEIDMDEVIAMPEEASSKSSLLAGVLVVDEKGAEAELAETFDAMGLRPEILKGIYGMGFERPSPIQMTAIRPLLKGRDLRAQAQSGTGKTAAFGIASLQTVDPKIRDVQVIIMETTRELAIQTTRVLSKLGSYTNITIEAIYGGVKVSDTLDKLKKKPQILVGTPGRLLHVIDMCQLNLSNVRLFILDEADEMLKKGFLEPINILYNKITNTRLQVGLFSATWSREEQEITAQILNEPVIISLKDEDQTLKGIKQYYINVGDKRGSASVDMSKFEILCDLYNRGSISQSVIFCNKVERAVNIQKNMIERGFECEIFHSELPQEVRNDVMRRFAEGNCRTLVSSGLLARGMDVQTLSVVINFDVPHEKEIENYIHRIGRAGRYGRKGTAINLVSSEDVEMIRKYEKHYNTTIAPLPSNIIESL